MTHDDYWKSVWHKAHERLDTLLMHCASSIHDILGNENGITSSADAKCVLAFILRHHPSCDEESCAIISCFEAVQAVHELNEHQSAGAA